jgi:general secretion pathway protein K
VATFCLNPRPRSRRRAASGRVQHGAAIITAMLVVTLAAVVVSSLFWREHVSVRSVENRLALSQSRWIERAGLDWAKVILREDQVRGGPFDHLGEPWAVPVVDTRLDETVTAGAQIGDSQRSAVLAAHMVDAQARLNLTSLAGANGAPSEPHLLALRKLMGLLDRPESLADKALERVLESSSRQIDGRREPPRRPPLTRLADLAEVEGFDPTTLAALEPFVIVLFRPTTVNVNTAPAEVISALIPSVDLSSARRFVARRERTFFRTLDEAGREIDPSLVLPSTLMSVNSSFFLVRGVIRYDRVESQSETLLERMSDRVEVVWQHRF